MGWKFYPGDSVGIVACSNGLPREDETEIEQLKACLIQMGLIPIFSSYIYRKERVCAASAKERAKALMRMMEDDRIKAVFDISGGDLANGLLEYLDYEKIKACKKPFFGYSDLTVLLNGIYQKTGMSTYWYQVKNLVKKDGERQKEKFYETFFQGKRSLYDIHWKFIQGKAIEGIVVGGNLRCFLKLAGTPYFPDVNDKILFLESLGGEEAVLTALLVQLRQIGVFEKIRGILLGTFTKIQKKTVGISIETLVREIIDNPNIPIAKTEEVGHGENAACLMIGGWIQV